MFTNPYTKAQLLSEGFAVINNVFTSAAINTIIEIISDVDTTKLTVRRSADLFAIRQFLKEVPAIRESIFTPKLCTIIKELFGDDYFIVKSIYFDKPEGSNWFVAYHQDLTISVDSRIEADSFGPWTVKHNQFAVQPPLHILENNFTIRIHLDDTDEYNGALRVIPKSHLKGIYRPETIDRTNERETICNVKAGSIMIMKPLLLHASSRTTNHKKRRVIHIEFSNQPLPEPLQWTEKEECWASFL